MSDKYEDKLWKGLEEVFKNKDTLPTPWKSFSIGGISVLIWKHFKFKIEHLDTYPYKMDGEIPMVFVDFGPIELIFENKWVYWGLYYWKYKKNPRYFEKR